LINFKFYYIICQAQKVKLKPQYLLNPYQKVSTIIKILEKLQKRKETKCLKDKKNMINKRYKLQKNNKELYLSQKNLLRNKYKILNQFWKINALKFIVVSMHQYTKSFYILLYLQLFA